MDRTPLDQECKFALQRSIAYSLFVFGVLTGVPEAPSPQESPQDGKSVTPAAASRLVGSPSRPPTSQAWLADRPWAA